MSAFTTLQIFTAQTANGSSLPFSGNGKANLKISGVFGGASIDLESIGANANDTFTTTGDAAIVVASSWNISYVPGIRYRLTISGATETTNINSFASQ